MDPSYPKIVALGVVAWAVGSGWLWLFGTGWLAVSFAVTAASLVMRPVLPLPGRVSTDA